MAKLTTKTNYIAGVDLGIEGSDTTVWYATFDFTVKSDEHAVYHADERHTYVSNAGWRGDDPNVITLDPSAVRKVNDLRLPDGFTDDDTDTRPMDAVAITEALRKSKGGKP